MVRMGMREPDVIGPSGELQLAPPAGPEIQ